MLCLGLGVGMVTAVGSGIVHADELDHQLFQWSGDMGGTRFGAAVAAVGDADGDGVVDVVVGAPKASITGGATGRAVIFSGTDGMPLTDLAAPVDASWFGHCVAGAGDIDGDGRADVAIGAPYASLTGRVTVYSGTSGVATLILTGVKGGDRFGYAVAAAGDVDLDGVTDLIVGSPFHDGAIKDVGRVAVISGASGVVLHESLGSAFLDQHGHAVAGVGDVDLDGVPDVLAGAPLADGGAFNGGEAWIYSGATGAALRMFAGNGIADQLGFDVSAAGDVDGDGVPDVLVGIPAADVNGVDSGLARVYRASDGAVLRSIAGAHAGDGLGFVSAAGDVDGDGFDDVLVGAPSDDASAGEAGVVFLVSGNDGSIQLALHGASSNEWFGVAMDGGFDLNGDGVPDLIAGGPAHDDHPELAGVARVYSTAALALTAGGHMHSLGSGGTTPFRLNAGPAHAGRKYLLAGTTAGTDPGIVVGQTWVPLNPTSAYFLYTVQSPNSAPLSGSLGLLDTSGRAVATFSLPPGAASSAAGLTLHHAYVVLGDNDEVLFASNAVPLTLTP